MASRSEFYRGKRKRSGPTFVISLVVITLVALVILLFYGLQKYIVISDGGLRLDIPMLSDGSSEDTGSRVFEPVSAELIIGEPDYDNVKAVAGEGLEAIRALFVPSDKINAESLNACVQKLGDNNALMLELKTSTGLLAWHSGVHIAEAYGTTGDTELAPLISELKSQGIYLIAQLCCLTDNALADRYPQLSLHTQDGAPFSDSDGAWLDPYSAEVRGYITELCSELADMGFDEVVLTDLRHPVSSDGKTFIYSGSTSTEPTVMGAVSSFAMNVSRKLRTSGLRVSVMVDGSTLDVGENTENGQNMKLLYKVFDRAYASCPSSDAAAALVKATAFVELGDANARFVPVCYGSTPPTGCSVTVGS